MVRIWTPNGYRILGYYRLKSEAQTALITAATQTPPPSSPNLLLSEVYNAWSEKRFPDLSKQSIVNYKRAWTMIQPIHNKPIRHITVTDIENAVLKTNPAPCCRDVIKSLLGQLFRYGIAHDMCEKNLAPLIDIAKPVDPDKKIQRRPFTYGEVSDLFSSDDPVDQLALIGCYTGMRPNELLSLSTSEVDLETGFFRIAGSKTENGLFRAIPIHPAILSTVTKWLGKRPKSDTTRLIPVNRLGHRMRYDNLNERLKKINHTPHDTRHTFITYARTSGLDSLAVKKIVGHTSKDLTETVYTHLDENILKREIYKFVIL